jgi:hypothetical protein
VAEDGKRRLVDGIFRDNGSNTAKWLKSFFGLSLLPMDEVLESLINDIMDDALVPVMHAHWFTDRTPN